ncbi:hypothetical protein HYW20_06635 [Candidatus Woesearchaeota archaeon]|nr:hypothetical protein [Candidatus Woesearchaeota archaeon]
MKREYGQFIQDIKESVKVNCTFCGKEIECPKDMLQKSKKHMCYDCFQNAGELAKEEDLGEVHVDIPMDELIPENLTILTDKNNYTIVVRS